MNIFKIIKDGKRKYIKFCGIKICLERSDKYTNMEIRNEKMFNFLMCDKMDIATKRRIIEQLFARHGNKYFPNIENPRTFNEKIQWLNLYYHDPLITKCVDKVTFKDYLHEMVGDEYTVPTIGVYNDASEIDFQKLPDEYVLKSNWGGDSSQVFIKTKENKSKEDNIKRLANSWLHPLKNLYNYAFCWGYKDIKPKLCIEELLKPDDGVLLDYKFLCFNGEPKYAFVVYDRRTNMALDFFDMEWNKLDFTRQYKNSKITASKPKNFEKMKEISRILSKPFPFVRVDFYEVNGKLYVGELTFSPGGGFEPFKPVEWDYKMGSYLDLPEKMLDSRDF